MSSAQGELDGINQYLRDNDFMINEARDLYSRWQQLTFEDKRSIVELIVKDIVVAKDEIEINLFHVPTANISRHPLLKDGEMGNYPSFQT